MTIWNSIKAFLNSKLGKDGFESLDEMMVSGWKLRPSTHSIYYAVWGEITYDYKLSNEGFIITRVKITDEIRKTYKAYGDGEITILSEGVLGIYKNDIQIYLAEHQNPKYQNVSFAKGDVLTIVLNRISISDDAGSLIIYGEEYKDEPFTM